MSIMDVVKLRRAESRELQLLQAAAEEEERVMKLKRRLIKRAKRAERKKKDHERMTRGNEELALSKIQNEKKHAGSGLLKSVNFTSSLFQLESNRDISCSGDGEEVDRDTPHSSHPKRALEQETLRPNTGGELRQDLQLSSAAAALSSRLHPAEFTLPHQFTAVKPKEENKNYTMKEEPLLRETQLLDIINMETQLQCSPQSQKKRRIEAPKQKERSYVLFARRENVSSVCFLDELSLRFHIYCDKKPLKEIGPLKLASAFQDPLLVFFHGQIIVKEFCIKENMIQEKSFSVLSDGEDFARVETCCQIDMFLQENVDIDSFVSLKVSDTKVAIFHNIEGFTRGNLINFQHERKIVQHFGSTSGHTTQLLPLHGCDNVFLSLNSIQNKLYFWNHETGKCVRVVQMSSQPPHSQSCRLAGSVLVSGKLMMWHALEYRSLQLSVLKATGECHRLEIVPLDEESGRISDSCSLVGVKGDKFMFMDQSRLVVVRWQECGDVTVEMISDETHLHSTDICDLILAMNVW